MLMAGQYSAWPAHTFLSCLVQLRQSELNFDRFERGAFERGIPRHSNLRIEDCQLLKIILAHRS
jgi:predicted secreted Zn-dependent protease